MASVMAQEPVCPSFPEELHDLPIWLDYRMVQRPGEPKPAKVAYRLDGKRRYGRQGTPEDYSGMGTLAQAWAALLRDGHHGLSIAPRKSTGLVFVDMDNVIRTDGSLDPIAERFIGRTYGEISPGKCGLRIIFRGEIGALADRKVKLPSGVGVETFVDKGHVTMTGNVHELVELVGNENHIADLTADDVAFFREVFGPQAATFDPDDFMVGHEPKPNITDEQVDSMLPYLDSGSGRNDGWLTVGMALSHHYDGSDEGFDRWHEWSLDAHNYTGEESMRYQWERFREGGEGRPRITMASVIKMARDAGWRPTEEKPVSAETLREEAASATQDTFDGKFRPTRASRLSDKPTQWHIKGILPSTLDPVILFGSSGAGKSFVALELACSIVRGVNWRGHRTRKGRVLYIAAEGMGGIHKRLQAYCRKHEIDIDDLDIDVIGASPNILEVDDVKEITKSIAAFGPYDLVIVDTLAQVTPGANENAGEDMGKALANIKAVQRATGATVMVIHHAGKDTSKGARGWSGIKAAAEAQIEVYRDEETGARHIHIEKMKDGEDGMRLGFTLETMVLYMDEDGDEVSSCVVTEAEFVAPVAKSKGGPVRGVTVRGGVQGAIAEAVHATDPSLATMRLAAFIDEVMKLMPEADEGKRDTRRQNVARAIRSWSGKADAPLSIQGELVVFHE